MDNLIVIEGKEKYMFNNIEELVKALVSEDFYELNDAQKLELLEMRAIANTGLNKDINFVLKDEYTYILSLAKYNRIMLLEKVDAKIYGKYIDNIDTEDNYIVVNKLADKIMKNYLEGRK